MLFKNFTRELGGSVSKFISIIIIAAVAVMMFTSFQALGSNGERIYESFFDEYNVADYWVSGTDLDMSDLRLLRRLDFVNDIQCRNSVSSEDFRNSDVTLTVYGVNEFNINIPCITEGDYPSNSSDVDVERIGENSAIVGYLEDCVPTEKEDKNGVGTSVYTVKVLPFPAAMK